MRVNDPAAVRARRQAGAFVAAARCCPDRRLRRALLIQAAEADAQVRDFERILRRQRRRRVGPRMRPAVKVAACAVALLVLASAVSLLPLPWAWFVAGSLGAAGSVFLTFGLAAPGGLLRH